MVSGGILSTPPAFPFLRFFIAWMTIALDMAFVIMFNVGPSSNSGGSTDRSNISIIVINYFFNISYIIIFKIS